MSSTIFIFIIIVFVAVWIAFSPIFKNSETDLNMILDNTPDTQRNLQLKRSELMLTLKELDFDFEMGKLSKEDYISLKKKYENETIGVLRQIDFEKIAWEEFQKQLDQKLEQKDA